MIGFLKKGNWGLRLLALVLAIVVYFAIRNDTATNNGNGKDHERHLFQSK